MLPHATGSVAAVSVMRRQRWTTMDDAARAALFGRGLDDIFDPDLRASIGTLIDDVRDRGDDAVCDALRTFDGIDLAPEQLRVTPREIAAAIVSDAVDAAIDDAIDHLRRFNEAQMERGGDWQIESEPGLDRRREGHPDQLGRAVHAVGQGELSERRLPARRAGRRGRRPADRARRAADSRERRRGRLRPCWSCAANSGSATCSASTGRPASPRSGSARRSFPQVRKIVGPGSPAVTIAQVEMQRHGVATMMLLGPTESVVIADDSADPIRLAADLLIEAEHGTDSSVVLITTSGGLADRVEVELEPPTRRSPRRAGHGGAGRARSERWMCARRLARRCRRGRQRVRARTPAGRRHRLGGRRSGRLARQRGRDPRSVSTHRSARRTS